MLHSTLGFLEARHHRPRHLAAGPETVERRSEASLQVLHAMRPPPRSPPSAQHPRAAASHSACRQTHLLPGARPHCTADPRVAFFIAVRAAQQKDFSQDAEEVEKQNWRRERCLGREQEGQARS